MNKKDKLEQILNETGEDYSTELWEVWISRGLERCLDNLRTANRRHDVQYMDLCMRILRLYYGDIMDSPLYKLMSEIQE